MTEQEAVASGVGESTVGDVLDTAEAGRRVVTGGAIRIAGYAIGLLASLASAVVMLRYLGKVDYGRFGTVTALITIVQFVTDLGMTTLGVREYSQRTDADRDRFMRVLLGMRLATTAVIVAVSTGLAFLLGYDHEMLVGAILLGVAAGISAMAGTIAIPLQVEIRMGIVTGIDVARQVGVAVAFIALSAAGAGLIPFFGVAAPVYFLVLLITYVYVRGSIPLRPEFDLAEWKRLVRPTLVFALATAVGGIYVYGAMVITELVTSGVETGYFAAAFRVFIIVGTFPALLAGTAFPLLSRAARDDHSRLGYAGQKLLEGSAILGGAALVSLVLGAQVVMDVIGGGEYDPAVPVLRVQGTALALTFVIASFGYTLLALHRHKAIIAANLSALAASATAVTVLGSTHGALGASYGVLLGETTLAVTYLIALGNLRPRAGRALRTIPPIVAALLCWFLPVPPLATVTIGLVVYAGGLMVCRAVPSEILALIPGRGRAVDDNASAGVDDAPVEPIRDPTA